MRPEGPPRFLLGLRARLLFAFGAALGLVGRLLRIRRKVIDENLRRAFPERSAVERQAIARGCYRALGRSVGEMLLVRGLDDGQLEQWVTFDGFERYEQAAAFGKGVIVAIAHFGNWELLGRACARRGVRLASISRTLRGLANRWVVRERLESGLGQLADRGSTAQALAQLRSGGVLALAIDQNMRPKRGIFVDFFGQPACTTPAPAVYSLRTGAPIVAAFPLRQPDGRHLVLVQGPFAAAPGLRGSEAVRELTEQLTRAVEALVRAHPEQWYWLHRRWKTQPSDAP